MKLLMHVVTMQAGLIEVNVTDSGENSIVETTPIQPVKQTTEICIVNGEKLVNNISDDNLRVVAQEMADYAAYCTINSGLEEVKKKIKGVAEKIPNEAGAVTAQA